MEQHRQVRSAIQCNSLFKQTNFENLPVDKIKTRKKTVWFSWLLHQRHSFLESIFSCCRKAPSSEVVASLTHLCWCQFLAQFLIICCVAHFSAFCLTPGLVRNHLIEEWPPPPSCLPLTKKCFLSRVQVEGAGLGGTQGARDPDDPSSDSVILNINPELHMLLFDKKPLCPAV